MPLLDACEGSPPEVGLEELRPVELGHDHAAVLSPGELGLIAGR